MEWPLLTYSFVNICNFSILTKSANRWPNILSAIYVTGNNVNNGLAMAMKMIINFVTSFEKKKCQFLVFSSVNINIVNKKLESPDTKYSNSAGGQRKI